MNYFSNHSRFYSIILSTPIRWSLFIICSITVLYGMFKPEPPAEVFTHSDKAGHFIAFFTLSLSAKFAMTKLPWFWFASMFFTLSFFLEFLQSKLRPLRIFSLEDSYSNAFGVCLSILFLIVIKLKFPNVFCIFFSSNTTYNK